MKRPVLIVDTQARIVAANEAAAELLAGKPASALAGMELDQLLADLGAPKADGRPRWMRFADGRRRWMATVMAGIPGERDRSLLVLRDAGLCALEGEACGELRSACDALEQGGAASDALHGLCNSLARSLDLALVRIVTADAQAREIAIGGSHAVADAVRCMTRVADAEDEARDHGFRQSLPALKTIRLPDGGCRPSLTPLGVHCAVARPLTQGPQPCVLELYGYGRDDFEDAPTAEFLSKWLPWIRERLARCEQQRQHRLLADALAQAVTPAFITDHEGVIVWINAAFSRQYGYGAAQAIGKTPRLLQSGEHGERYYRGLWTAILGGRAWSGRTIDRAADGRLFVVRQTITPLHRDGRVTHFLAIHSDITEDAELTSIADARQSDALTGLMTWDAFREYGREALLSAGFAGVKWTFMLIAVTSRTGQVPALQPEAQASIYGDLGERIRSWLPAEGVAASLGHFDFGLLLPEHAATADLSAALAEAITAPLPLLGDTLGLECHAACAGFPADGATVDELRKAADRRLAEVSG